MRHRGWSRLRAVFDYALAYEKEQWDDMAAMAEALRLDEAGVPVLYLHSVQWAQRSVGEIKAAG